MINWLERKLFSIFAIWYAIGVVLLVFNLVPQSLDWANTVFLVMAGGLAMVFFYQSYGRVIGLLIIFIIFVLSTGIESIGVHTGLIFGDYAYMDDFGYHVIGVPATIGFAWLMVMATSHALATPLIKATGIFSCLLYSAYGAVIATTLDLILDPVAFVVKKYWIWNEGGVYYGIPAKNFVGWLSLSFILHLLIWIFRQHKFDQGRKLAQVPGRDHEQAPKNRNVQSQYWEQRMVWLYGMIGSMFIIIGLVNGLILGPIIVGILILIYYVVYHELKRHQ